MTPKGDVGQLVASVKTQPAVRQVVQTNTARRAATRRAFSLLWSATTYGSWTVCAVIGAMSFSGVPVGQDVAGIGESPAGQSTAMRGHPMPW